MAASDIGTAPPAIAICDEALAVRHGDTDDGWRQVIVRRKLAGHLRRSQPATAWTPTDGNPTEIVPHLAEVPTRRRAPRFRFT